MKKLMSIVVAALMLASMFAFAPKAFAQQPTMAIRPSKSTDLEIGEEFYVDITFRDFTDLYGWQVGIQWDPSKLECTGVLYGQSVWAESIFKVLAPTRTALPQDGTIDNAAGKIYPPYSEGLTGVGGVTGTPGTEYKLMRVYFTVEAPFPDGTEISFIISDPYGPVSCWAAWPNVSELLTPAFETATIRTKYTAPYGPTAAFTYTPTYIMVGTSVKFDASASKGGFDGTASCPITEYRWDFETDGTWDIIGDPDTAKIVYHAFDAPGDYNVTLEVYAPGNYPPGIPDTDNITKTITVFAPAMGAQLDLTSNKEVNGLGPGQPSDAFAPQELVVLCAKVTYNGEPVANKLVGFEVKDPDGTPVIYRVNVTNEEGIACVSFRLPSDPPFGDWLAIAKVEVAQNITGDTMPFKVGWIVEIVSVEADKSSYAKGEMASFTVKLNNIAFTTKTVVLTITVYDACGVPIYATSVSGWSIEGEAVEKEFQFTDVLIPNWAFISPPAAWVYVNVFTDTPQNGGVPYCPEASNWFTIVKP